MKMNKKLLMLGATFAIVVQFDTIAMAANVPICLGYINYKNKTLGFKSVLYPSGDIEADMKIIADFYTDIEGKRPENQGPIKIRSK